MTEEKTSDRTQYRDRVDGDTLYWQGQTSGRSDRTIINHSSEGLELLIFLRRRKYEHPGAGFRYLGLFDYVSHEGVAPTSFVLARSFVRALPVIGADVASIDPFDPTNIADARERVARTIAQRRGQKGFRDALIAAYEGRCAVSGCDVKDVLEAAHIYPYRGPETNLVSNGLLLRADIHTLFDCELIAVDPVTMAVVVAPSLFGSIYDQLHGRPLRLPAAPDHFPSKVALSMHRKSAGL